jgi:hypothetical protein
MKRPSPRRLWFYVTRRLGLRSYCEAPGDGRKYPQIPAKTLLWALLLGQLLRECTFHGVESLVRISGCRALLVSRIFSDDTLAYFTERLDVGRCRQALLGVLRRAKRNKVFAKSRFIGLAVWQHRLPTPPGGAVLFVPQLEKRPGGGGRLSTPCGASQCGGHGALATRGFGTLRAGGQRI